MKSPCDLCQIRTNCDFLSGMCRLTSREIITVRPDLIYGYKRVPTTGVTRKQYFTNWRRNQRAMIAIERFEVNPDGVFARRRMKRL